MKLIWRRVRSWLRGPSLVATSPERVTTYTGRDGVALYFHDLGCGVELTPEGARELSGRLVAAVIYSNDQD